MYLGKRNSRTSNHTSPIRTLSIRTSPSRSIMRARLAVWSCAFVAALAFQPAFAEKVSASTVSATNVSAPSDGQASPVGIQKEVLLRTSQSWDGVPYEAYPNGAPELTMVKFTLPPNAELPWHTHPMPNAGYILDGEITVQKRSTGQTLLLKKGDVIPEMVGGVHRGLTGNLPATLIVFYAGTKGLPLANTVE